MKSYFEIGGELIEVSTSPSSSQRPGPSVVRRIAEQPREGRRGTAGGRKSEKGYGITGEQLFSKSGSARRATTAIRMAAALALVDGPLPVGDALAATVLMAYAGYEVSRIITE